MKQTVTVPIEIISYPTPAHKIVEDGWMNGWLGKWWVGG